MGEEVCLVRNGCLLHLRRYAQLPDYATEPLPPPAAELNSAIDIIKALPPVTRYKVLAVAYCQYPKPTPPPVQQQQQQPDMTGLAGAPGQQQQQLQGLAAGPAAQQQQGQQLQQQQQPGPQGMSKSGKKSRSRSKSLSSWGLGYDDDDDEERSGNEEDEEADESESNSEDDEFNDRTIHLTGIDSDTDGLGSASRQQQSASQSMQQHGQQPSQQQQANGEAAQQQQLQLQQQQQQQAMVAQQRPPCMWLLLCPVSNGSAGNSHGAQAPVPALTNGTPEDQPDDMLGQHLQPQESHQQQPGQQKLPCVAVPLHIDGDLPDYLVQPAMFEASLQRRWLPQDRCSMFIGSRQVRDTAAALTLITTHLLLFIYGALHAADSKVCSGLLGGTGCRHVAVYSTMLNRSNRPPLVAQ